jgi:hypothetical protein
MAIIPTIEYETKLQERLDAPMAWKEICKVHYTDTGIMRNPYLTDSTVGTGTRGTGYTSTAVDTTDDTVTISAYVYSAQHIDDADLAQKTFSDFMQIADNMGTILNERMETNMLLEHAQWTNFDNASIGGGAGNITVSVSNIKNIITAMKTAIRTAGGAELAARNGMFIQWREADFEKVELLASSEGFNTADDALKNGIKQGFKYMGVEHYSTSRNVSGHVFGGVKKAFDVGVVKSTYGKMKTIINPVVSSAQISGVGLESRIDHKFKAWTKMVPVLFDILVA